MMNLKKLAESVNATLLGFGFSKDGFTWNRNFGESIDVIDLQVSKSKSDVTVNCGVFHKKAYSLVWGRDLNGTAPEPLCVVRARVGGLIDGHDVWWKTSHELTKEGVIRGLTDYCLPFLERVRSDQAIEAHLEKTALGQKYPLPKIYFAVMKVLNGERAAGCSLLADIQKKTIGDWRERAREVVARLNC